MRSREESRNHMFPVGLYGTLLFGLVGITVPELVAPVERIAQAIVSLPLRAYSILLDTQPALAATTGSVVPPDLSGELRRGVLHDAVGPSGHVPRVCRVLRRVVGPLDSVDELILDVPRAEVAGCAPLVTAGPGLLGFLADSRADSLADDFQVEDSAGKTGSAGGMNSAGAMGAELARVRLLHYRPRRPKGAGSLRVGSPERAARVAARVRCRESFAQADLHFLVEPARAVDRWPLRCTLLDDAYLGSRLRRSGDVVTTSGNADSRLPDGLVLGRLMIWGYPQLDIPVGLFVEPVRDPRSISSVVLWEPADGAGTSRSAPAGGLQPVRFTRFPAPRPVGERWMVTAGADTLLREGAALVDSGRLLGTLKHPWSGQSLVTPFAASSRSWAFVLQPADDVGGPVHEFVGRVASPLEDGLLRIRVEDDPLKLTAAPLDRAAPDSRGVSGGRTPVARRVLRGELFTGSNGPDCPAGFYIGSIRAPAAGAADELVLVLPELVVSRPHVFVGPEVDTR